MKHRSVIIVSVLSLLLILSSCNDNKDWENAYNQMYSHLTYCWAQSLDHADATIAFYGDSRVIGADWYSAYPEQKVINLGVGGDKVQDLIDRIGLLEQLENLQACFVAIGGNDCLNENFDIQVFRNRYSSLLDLLSGLGIKVYVNTIAGVTDTSSVLSKEKLNKTKNNMIQANEAIRALAEEKNLTVIDMATVMNNPDDTLKTAYAVADGVHFSEAGNQVWYDTLRPYVENP